MPPPTTEVVKKKEKDVQSLNYSIRETEILKELWVLVVNNEEVLKGIVGLVDAEEFDEFCESIIHLGVATGVGLQMVRTFVEEDFQKNTGSTEGSIMRGNTVASKIAKAYLNIIGRKYLKETMGPVLHKLVIEESKLSYEIDPSKCDPEDFEKNKSLLTERTKLVVDKIMDPKIVDKMPAEMRIIASYFSQLANLYAPKEKLALIGGFILLRYISPAISTPETYQLLPEGKVVNPKQRRNLVLIAKIIQVKFH
eukprot:TRINITY_DN1225_c0_g1_i1.p1 TRINITY_DN1225_c0_g1~~TRINITY_DN1225_c0_g1_i1.p1  ORF type:complete len:253 (+),score=71.45 TRINITY_DN1225_c0_g1_i1:88-846(+)